VAPALASALALAAPTLLSGQGEAALASVSLGGRVVLGTDSIPVPGLDVSLHRIGAEEGGVAGADVTDDRGRFAFSVEASDNEEDRSTVYLVTARYKDVVYFGEALHMVRESSDDYVIVVYDTKPVVDFPLSSRQTVVATNGSAFEVLDMFELSNDADSSLVRAAEAKWMVRLPDGAGAVARVSTGFGMGNFEVTGDVVRLDFEIPPGGRTFNVQYLLTQRVLRVPASAVGDHEVLIDPRIEVASTTGWTEGDLLNLGGRQFRRLAARAGAGEVELTIPGAVETAPGRHAWWMLALGVLLAAAAVLTWRLGLRRNDGVA
jgi:hypothetical protein